MNIKIRYIHTCIHTFVWSYVDTFFSTGTAKIVGHTMKVMTAAAQLPQLQSNLIYLLLAAKA